MKKLLITGFEPFGGEQINPSWEAVSRLPEVVGVYNISKILLPVSFHNAFKMVDDMVSKIKPNTIICVGQAGGRNAITPEFVAINFRTANIPDNDGYKPIDENIVEYGQNAYFSTLPVKHITSAIQNAGITAQISYSAGTYVCNDLLYKLLHKYFNNNIKIGFIHVPYCIEQNKTPSMQLDAMVRGLKIAIENID